MNNSRSSFILFSKIIISIGAVVFLAKLALISTGSWLWLIEIFAVLLIVGIIGHYLNRDQDQPLS